MSATMTRQWGWVQLEQSDMCLALNMAKMAKGGSSCAAIEEMEYLMEKPNTHVREEKKWGLGFQGMKMWRLRRKDSQLWLVKLKWMPAFLDQMAQYSICSNAEGAKAWVHLDETDSGSWHQNRRHIHPECHLYHLVTLREPTLPKSKVCHLDMCIYILHFPVLNFSILMHMPRITSTMKILFQICWLMKEHPQIITLSAVWYCSWHPFCRRQRPIERTCKWTWALIERNGILECIIVYNYWTL